MQNPSLRLPPPQPSQFYLTPRGQTMAGSCLDAPGMEKPCTHRAPSAAAALTSAPGAPRGNAGSQGSLCPRADGVFLSHGLTPRAAQQPLLLFGGDIKKKKKELSIILQLPAGPWAAARPQRPPQRGAAILKSEAKSSNTASASIPSLPRGATSWGTAAAGGPSAMSSTSPSHKLSAN